MAQPLRITPMELATFAFSRGFPARGVDLSSVYHRTKHSQFNPVYWDKAGKPCLPFFHASGC
jgi:hypothetical protein